MKKIFPVITVLILLSLFGLIFFQYKWIESAKDFKVQQLENNLSLAIAEAAEKLMVERSIVPGLKNSKDLLFAPEKKINRFIWQFRYSTV